MFLLAAALIFSAALFAAGWYVWSVPAQHQADTLTARLREIRSRGAGGSRTRAASELMRQQQKGKIKFLSEFLSWLGPIRRLQEFIDQANMTYRAGDVLALCFVILVAAYLALGILGVTLFFLRLIFAALLAVLPVFFILRARAKRMARFEENLPDAIDLFNRSMRAGHNIHSGLETIAAETMDPIKMEFRKVVEELGLGSPLEAALHNLGRRMPLLDLKFFITGLILQRQTGANMVSVLENLSVLIRERLNLAAKMKAATTQQRFSAGLLCSLPIVMALGFWIIKPEYIRLLYTDETGTKFLTYAIVSEIIGILIIRKISNPKF